MSQNGAESAGRPAEADAGSGVAGTPSGPRPQLQLPSLEGLPLPPGLPGKQPWPDQIRDLRQMTLRDDDVILLTYPKAGTNWLWETMTMLRKGNAEHEKTSKVQLMMEFVRTQVLDAQPSPRTLNTHLPLSMLPVPEMKSRRLKTVHVYRNPKDVCVSMFHHLKTAVRLEGADLHIESFAEFFEFFFFVGKQFYGSYFLYMKQLYEFQQSNPDVESFNLSYENVKKDPVGSVQRLASFLELDVSRDLCVRIADECSFDKMKTRAADVPQPQSTIERPKPEALAAVKTSNPVIYRKGQIGDWKNYFTVAMSERADALIQEKMKNIPFTLTFE